MKANPIHFKILVILMLVYTVFATFFGWIIEDNMEIYKLLVTNDIIISLVILSAFFYELKHSEDRLKFMKTGWIYLVAALPLFEAFTSLNFYFGLLRFFLIIKIFKSDRKGADSSFSATKSMIMIGAFILLICSSLILYVENVPDGNIKTAIDAIYWSVVTVATVGYGDLYPVTAAGKIISIIMIFSGAGIFVSLAGTFSNFLIKKRNQEE